MQFERHAFDEVTDIIRAPYHIHFWVIDRCRAPNSYGPSVRVVRIDRATLCRSKGDG